MEQYSFVLFVLAVAAVANVAGHGMMLEPPQRSSMWRFGYNVPANYDDNGLFCGGVTVSS